jgi:phospholipid/cholesterol/gamma-HCH transport system ATP-binding protein
LANQGCGKSVLLKIIYQLIRNDVGSIFYDKKRIVDIDKFGMLFQYGALFDSLTVAENIAFIDFIDGKKNYKIKVINSLKEVGLSSDIYDKHPSEISRWYEKKSGTG